MEVKTKFNVSDKVYILCSGSILEAVISEIIVNSRNNSTTIRYRVCIFDSIEGPVILDDLYYENSIYESIDNLCKSLEDNATVMNPDEYQSCKLKI